MTPADAERARELGRLHAELFHAENRGLYGVLAVTTMMVLVASSLFRPMLAVLAGIVVIGAVFVVARAVRRRRNVRAFCRDARLVDAEVITPASPLDHDAGWYQELAIPDAERAVVARVKRRWPRTSLTVEPTRVTTWYAPTSSIVITFDPRGEPTLGRVESRPLPRATLQR